MTDEIAKAIAARKTSLLAQEQKIMEQFASEGEFFFVSLLNDLASEDYNVRWSAIKALGVLGDRRAVKPLLAILEEVFQNKVPVTIGTSRLAAQALSRIGNPEAIPSLMKVFTSFHNEFSLTMDMGKALAGIGTAVIPFLKEVMTDPQYTRESAAVLAQLGKSGEAELTSSFHLADAETRKQILSGITQVQSGDLVPFLQNVLMDETDENVRSSAIYALERIRTPLAVETLYMLLESKNVRDRARAVNALGWIKDKKAVSRLMALLNDDKNSDASHGIPFALKQINDLQVIPTFLELLKSDKGWVRKTAVRALGEIGNASHTSQVMNTALTESDADIKLAVIEALGKLQNPIALPYLIDSLGTDFLEGEAITALERLGKAAKAALPEIIKIIQNKDGLHRWSAVRCLGKIGDADVTDLLIELLLDEDISNFAADALEDLVQTGEKIDVHKLAAPLLSSEVLDYVRSHLAYILSLTENTEAVPYLIQALDDPSSNVRAHVIHALEDLGDPRAVSKLIECLDDEEIPIWPENQPGEPISQTAESALLVIGHPDGLKAIEDRRKTNNS